MKGLSDDPDRTRQNLLCAVSGSLGAFATPVLAMPQTRGSGPGLNSQLEVRSDMNTDECCITMRYSTICTSSPTDSETSNQIAIGGATTLRRFANDNES